MADETTGIEGEDEPLVLAMPRRELFRIAGFTTAIDIAILESLGEDTWWCMPSSLVGNLDAKEVRLGLVIERGDGVLVDEGGSLLHTTRLSPDIARLGTGIKALRDLARLAGARFLAVERLRVELIGYLNDDSLPGLKEAFILVYRCRAGDDAATPPGMSWVPPRQLAALALDPASAMVGDALFAAKPA